MEKKDVQAQVSDIFRELTKTLQSSASSMQMTAAERSCTTLSREDVLEKWGDCVAEQAYADRKGCEIIKENAPYYNDGLAESDVEEILKADSPREKLEAIIDKDYAEDEDWESLAEDAYYDDLDEDEQEEVDPAEFSEEFECSTTYDYEHSPIKEQTVFADGKGAGKSPKGGKEKRTGCIPIKIGQKRGAYP